MQVWYAMQIFVRRYLWAMQDGQAGRSAGTWYALCDYAMQRLQNGGKNGRQSLQNRGIVDILYEGFRKCFVNCKFTFYITLSSYYKKVKIRKTRKNHSKM